MGPSLSTPRHDHSSCAIKSDDGSTQSVIIVGGRVGGRSIQNGIYYSKTTEVLTLNTLKWVEGPKLLVVNSGCVVCCVTSNIKFFLCCCWR